jgi:hypothetical protein
MDAVFGVSVDEMEDDVETTVLLRNERGAARRASFGAYT